MTSLVIVIIIIIIIIIMKKALRETQTLSARWFGHRPPARYTPTDRTDYSTLRHSWLIMIIIIIIHFSRLLLRHWVRLMSRGG